MKIITIIMLMLLLVASSVMAQGFGKNYVRNEDLKWYVLKTDNFDVHYYKGSEFLADYTAEMLEEIYSRQRDLLQINLSRRIPVILYASPRHFQQNNMYPISGDAIAGFSEPLKYRLVMPFNGSQRQYEETLTHEFAHIMQFEIWFANMGDIVTAVTQPPMWFSEGMPEHIADDWNPMGEMTLRDAIMSESLPTLGEMQTFNYLPSPYLGYKAGQSAVDYLVETYGEDVIGDLVREFKKSGIRGPDKPLEKVIGIEERELNDDWQVWVKKKYWPMIEDKQQLKEFSEQVSPRKDREDYITYFRPQWSPSGDIIACLTIKERFLDIFLINAETGEKFDNVTKGYSLNKYERINYFQNGVSWSPEGDYLAFIGRKDTFEQLYILDVARGKIIGRFNPKLEDMQSPSWSPDGEKIAFVGYEADRRDIYTYEIESGDIKKVTDDPYSDSYPSWSPDSDYIYYSSERDVFGNLFRVRPDSTDMEQLTFGRYDNISPGISPDGETILFSSNRYDGIYNLYTMDIETREVGRQTDVIGGVMDGSWSPSGDEIVFSAFENFIYSIHRMNTPEQAMDTPIVENPEAGEYVYDPDYVAPEESSRMIIEGEVLRELLIAEGEDVVTAKEVEAEVLAESEAVTDTDYGVAFDEDTEEGVGTEDEGDHLIEPIADTAIGGSPGDPVSPVTELKGGDVLSRSNKYKLKFSPNTMFTSFSYTTGGVFQNYTVVGFSDLLENQRFSVYFDLMTLNDVSDIDGMFEYVYQTKRPTYSSNLYTWSGYYRVMGNYFKERTSGVTSTVSYPFNMRNRVELSAFGNYTERDYYGFDERAVDNELVAESEAGGTLALVRDTTQWNYWTPIAGSRMRLSVTQTAPINDDSQFYTSTNLDVRRYIRISDRNSLAFRAVGGYNIGRDKPNYYLGGGGTVRGYPYTSMYGTWMGLANAEYRFPLIDYVVTPIPGFIFGFFRGVAFADVGTSWSGTYEIASLYPEKMQWSIDKEDEKFTEFTPWSSEPSVLHPDGGWHLVHIKPSFGVGFRWALGFVDMQFDWAWRTDLKSVVSEPVFHWTLGYDF